MRVIDNPSTSLQQGTNGRTIPNQHVYQHRLTLIPAWISKYMPSKVWDEITYPLANFSSSIVEVWEWISHFILHYIMDVFTILVTGPRCSGRAGSILSPMIMTSSVYHCQKQYLSEGHRAEITACHNQYHHSRMATKSDSCGFHFYRADEVCR